MSILTPNRYNNIDYIKFDINNNSSRNSQRQYIDSNRANNNNINKNSKILTHSKTFDNLWD